MPLCHFQSSFDVVCPLFPFLQSLPNVIANFPPGRTEVQPVLLRAFFFVTSSTLLFVRPTTLIQTSLHPTSFHDKLPRHMLVFVCPRLVCLSSQQSLDRIQPHSSFQLLTLVFGCPLLPIDHPGLFQMVLTTSCSTMVVSRSRMLYTRKPWQRVMKRVHKHPARVTILSPGPFGLPCKATTTTQIRVGGARRDSSTARMTFRAHYFSLGSNHQRLWLGFLS